MKRAFFILGAEGSGTRMLTLAFISAGCRGDGGHRQSMDDLDFSFVGSEDLVFRRSLPHEGEWPDLGLIAKLMQEQGYEVKPVLIHRKSDFVVAHQLRTDRVDSKEGPSAPYAKSEQQAWSNIRGGMTEAAKLACQLKTSLIVVPYEVFVESRDYRWSFFGSWGLRMTSMDFYNANNHERYAAVKALQW